MKKYVILMVVFATAILSGCSNEPMLQVKPAHLRVQKDTVIPQLSITTAARYACDGHRMREDKLTGKTITMLRVHIEKDTTIGDSSLRRNGYAPASTEDGSNSSSSIPGWLQTLLWIIVALIVIGLAIYFFMRLFRDMPARRTYTNDAADSRIVYGSPSEAGPVVHRTNAGNERYATNAHPIIPTPAPPSAPQENTEEVKEETASNSANNNASHLEILKQIQKTGGKINISPDGSLSIEIPEQFEMPLIVVIESEKPKKEKKS